MNAANQAVPLETYGGLVALVRPENCPEGASPRNYDMDYDVGSARTRDPLQNTVSFGSANIGPNLASLAHNVAVTGAAWSNPGAVTATDGSYAVCVPGTAAIQPAPRPVYSPPDTFHSELVIGVQSGGFTFPVLNPVAAPVAAPQPVTAKQTAIYVSDLLHVQAFAIALPGTATPVGITVEIVGFATSAVTLTAQLGIGGAAVGNAKQAAMPTALGTMTFGGAMDLWSANPGVQVSGTDFNVLISVSTQLAGAQALIDSVSMTVTVAESPTNFNFVAPFVAQDGSCRNLYLDADGSFYVEDVTNQPGVLNLVFDGVAPGSFASAVNGPDVEHVAFNDLTAGCDVPRQYTAQWTDRISQVGPGASPMFSAIAPASASTTFAIATITQPASAARGYSYFLQSAGPGSNQAGNVCTVYYADSSNSAPDADLVAAFNSGQPVYLYFSFTGGPAAIGPLTVQVTSVGEGVPPKGPRQFFYFTFVAQTTVYTLYQGSGHANYVANYQRTLATMTTAVPVPTLSVGANAVVSGDSVSAYNTSWPITQTLNSGVMAITEASLTGGLATYSYAVVSGQNPVAGQLVTITNVLNGDGALNVVATGIASVSGTNLGSFTVDGFSAATDFPAESESGQATTAGTEFCFEPGLATLGGSSSPIYGNGSGGEIVVAGSGQVVGPGTREGVVFFITRNGYYTAPGPPVKFTTPANTTAVLSTQIPIGPGNVIGRGIAFTEAGQNGVPGANFFMIPTPVQYVVQGVTYTAASTIIWDNTTTSASFNFTDAVLLNARAIDVQGFNLFNLIELGNPGWIAKYNSRNFYGLCQNKIQNFLNLSFDGGYLPGGQLVPLGWSVPDPYGFLLVSEVFGNSYYIPNGTGSTQAVLGLIAQSAYQDAYQQPILDGNTLYSVRVTARIPSSRTTGSLVIDLVDGGISYGAFTLPFAGMTAAFTTYTGTLLTKAFETVPSGLQLRCYAAAIGATEDVEIDRIEVFPTAIPVLATTVFGSYADQPESVDGVTGAVECISENQQPVLGAAVLYDTLYLLKQGSMYSLQANSNLEPADWGEPEVAQRTGACGVNAYDTGEQYIPMASRAGIYIFSGGQPGKIMQEIAPIWEAIHWPAGNSIWLRNDITSRRLLVGVPLPTPNFWLPSAAANPAPQSPNVILMLNYQGLDTGDEIKSERPLHTTAFGQLNTSDLKRKWSIWQIPCPYAAAVSKAGLLGPQKQILDAELRFCNGIGSSKVYRLAPEFAFENPGAIPTDDGAPIDSLYTTYGHVNVGKAAQMPLLGLFRKLWTYMTHQISGAGNLGVTFYPDVLLGPGASTTGYYPSSIPGGFHLTDPCVQVREAPLNVAATRTFVEFRTGGRMNISNLVMLGRKHPHSPLTGNR